MVLPSAPEDNIQATRGRARLAALGAPGFVERQAAAAFALGFTGADEQAADAPRPGITGEEMAAAAASELGTTSRGSSATRSHVLPWWPTSQQSAFHQSTRLVTGRSSLLVDPGAWANLIGANLVVKTAKSAKGHGHASHEEKMPQPLSIRGVGDGSPTCNWQVHLPIAAVAGSDGVVSQHTFAAPLAVSYTHLTLPTILRV